MDKNTINTAWKIGLKTDSLINHKTATNLIDIIRETPLALRPTIKIQKHLSGGFYDIHLVKGLTIDTPWGGKGIALSYECDNMSETLVHESLHIKFPSYEENKIILLTKDFYKNDKIRKTAQKRIVDKLTEYEINGKLEKYEKLGDHDL